MENKVSIAIIGEGETEWHYFDSLRCARRFAFKVMPSMPQHSDIQHIASLADKYASQEYDYVVCLVDMDRLLTHPKEMADYRALRNNSRKNVIWVETNPCTELWFLLHFNQSGIKRYSKYEELERDLQRYMPGYAKTKKYFVRHPLYPSLAKDGNLDAARTYAKKLCQHKAEHPKDQIAYSEIYKVFDLLDRITSNDEEVSSQVSTNGQRQIGQKGQEILDYLSQVKDVTLKSISTAISLKESQTRTYLKELIDLGMVETVADSHPKLYRKRH